MARGLFTRACMCMNKFYHFQVRLSYVRVKYLFLTWLAVFVGGWVVYVQYSSYTELCRAHQCHTTICDKYSSGVIDGSACSSLCDKDSLYFRRCLSTSPNNQVYTASWGDADAVIRCRLGYVLHYELGEELEPRKEPALFDKPTRGTSVEKFKEMVHGHLKVKVGEQADLSGLVSLILTFADSDHDGHVSLAEARSAWALLQLDEVLLSLVLRNRGHTPKLLGFCGDLYVVERVPYTPLYGLNLSTSSRSWIPGALGRAVDRFLAPSWPHKAKIAIGLLELVEDVFHGQFGSFLLCDMSPASFGYTERYELRLLDSRHAVPEEAFRSAMRVRPCRQDSDCVYSGACGATCRPAERRCDPEPSRPNLARACSALEDFLLQGAAAELRGELERQLNACTRLKGSSQQMEMEHSLMLNNLKMLLWKQISHTNDS
ncbi:divergent protein kinase domain 1A [Trichomycterus rosablanca]|uniref:divergent protein kinase domain 1A n=1 Tax=Trichomycterus rosablanca TaxID=2290929 RepID=UPI002F35D9AF